MKRRLCIGLHSPSSYLISILESIGVWYEEVDFDKDLFNSYSNLVFESAVLNSAQIQKVEKFLKQGGSVLEISTKPIFYSASFSRTFSKTIFNTNSGSEFDRLSHLDIYSTWASSTKSKLFSGLIDFQKYNFDHFNVGFIGLDLSSLPNDKRYSRKRFFSSDKEYPDEIVNRVSRDSLNDVIELCLQRLIHEQNLPFLKKWSFPDKKPVFGFRIDSDFGSKESLQNIYQLLKSYNIKASWFLHVKAHEKYLNFFKSFKDQEIALHGYDHGYSSSISKIEENINKGLEKLQQADLDVDGFCAPYGIWNYSMEQAISNFDFKYTSEFTSGYDSTPFFIPDTAHLQIPIHPICTGSLNRKSFSVPEMEQYFLDIYNQRKKLFKPVFFYHHPMQSGLSVFERIFEEVQKDDLTNLTFIEYAEFWNKRSEFQFTAFCEDDNLILNSGSNNLFLYVSTTPDEFELISPEKDQSIRSIKSSFKYETRSLPSLQNFRKPKSSSIQLLKTNILDWKNRYRL